jgi:N6-adenosine-specific RNA methylase IME4/ParB-like chromosome segregation protein Spo0J
MQSKSSNRKSVPLSSIRAGKRHRKDLGDVRALAQSIAEIGLLHPPVIRPDGVLIAGERRLRAVKLLGWKKVPVTVIDLDKIVRGEAAENLVRKNFSPSEMVAIARALEPLLRREAKARQGRRNDLREKSPDVEAGRVRDKLSECVGVSGRTLEKMMAIADAAEKQPRKFTRLKEEMDRTGKVTRPFRELLRAKDEQRILRLRPTNGKFRTLVIDAPWRTATSERLRTPYATMSHEELLVLPVSEWADENCHLYCWATNSNMADALELVRVWGFEQKTILTWVKPVIGLGDYFRNRTEHVVFAVRGKTDTRSDSLSNVFFAPRSLRHSEKPEVFYDLVRKASFPPYGEAFQRRPRPDFINLFGRGSGSTVAGRAKVIPLRA